MIQILFFMISNDRMLIVRLQEYYLKFSNKVSELDLFTLESEKHHDGVLKQLKLPIAILNER